MNKLEKLSRIISEVKNPLNIKFCTTLPNTRTDCEIALINSLKTISKGTKYEMFVDELIEICCKKFEMNLSDFD